MAVGKEIKTQIGSINNTQKITSAMEMVAASKMRKAQDQMASSRPYADAIREVIGHIAQGDLEYQHSWMVEREVKRVGYIVISTDRGLCGGLNSNEFRMVLRDVQEWKEKGVDVSFAAIGSKATSFLKRVSSDIKSQTSGLGDKPALNDLIGTVSVMLNAFDSGELDRLYLVYNKFVNTMTQQPVLNQLLPLPKSETAKRSHAWDYLYEPDAKTLLDTLLRRFIESQVYQGSVENLASEQAARMVAMKAATDNAGELIDELQLIYNKARQAAITQEISEIVSGAGAV